MYFYIENDFHHVTYITRSPHFVPVFMQQSLLRNCLPLADMRQGTTEVVAQVANPDSGIRA
jgi:hypothetical protein